MEISNEGREQAEWRTVIFNAFYFYCCFVYYYFLLLLFWFFFYHSFRCSPTTVYPWKRLLVEQNDVRQPNVIRRHVQHFQAAIIVGVPFQIAVEPFLDQPNAGGHHLTFEILKDQTNDLDV